jgi:DNA-binding winged helix-turn-helix (wHTH) protein
MFRRAEENSTMATYTHRVTAPAATCIVFGPFRLLPMQRLLTQSGKPVQLGSRAFDLLVVLLERPGELISKEELMARVWPNTFVAPENLSVQIAGLRRALGDGRGGNRYIVNTPGRGYRFVAPVTVETGFPCEVEAAAPADLPTPSMSVIDRARTAEESGESEEQRNAATILRPVRESQAEAALALLKKLLGTRENGVWVIDMRALEESKGSAQTFLRLSYPAKWARPEI